MIGAFLWALTSGFLARALLSGSKPGPVPTSLAGLGGCVLAFLVGHQLLSIHEFHLFRPESLIPAVIGSTALLLIGRRMLRTTRRSSIFT